MPYGPGSPITKEMVGFRDAPAAPAGPSFGMTITTSTSNDLRTVRETTVRAHMDAECRHDVAATLATFAEANYDVVPLGSPTNGALSLDG